MSDKEAREARKAAIARDRERVQRADEAALRRRDASTRAASTSSTATRSTRTCAWSSPPSSRSPSSAATPTTSPSPATTSTSASCAPTRTASRCRPEASLRFSAKGVERRRPRVRLRPPGLDVPPRDDGAARVSRATTACPSAWTRSSGGSTALREYAPAATSRSGGRKARSSASRTRMKALRGLLRGLLDAKAMARKAEDEKALRAKVAADPALAQAIGDPWATVGGHRRRGCLPRALDARARRLRRLAPARHRRATSSVRRRGEEAEREAPRGVRRLEPRARSGTRCSRRPRSTTDLEEATLADQLQLGPREARPRAPVREGGARRKDARRGGARRRSRGRSSRTPRPARRSSTAGEAAVAASTDPMIVLARQHRPAARARRAGSTRTRWTPRTTRAREDRPGPLQGVRPDRAPRRHLHAAPGSYGTVKGFPAEGTSSRRSRRSTASSTARSPTAGKAPWALPPRWNEKKGALELDTPLDFVSTNDIIGGNSGSPVVDREGRVRGDRLRRQHPQPGLELLLQRTSGGARLGRRPGDPGGAAQRSTAPTSWSAS